jgi:acetoin utilization protein AcuB
MTTGIAKLEPTDKINVAMEIFKENLFHAIPVVLDEKLVGIITTYDILSNVGKDKNVINEYELS